MPKKSKNFLDHANERATGLADRIGPQVESAVGTARDKAGPVLAEAREKAAPVIAEAREKAAPVIAEAREKAGPAVHDARDKFSTEVLPLLTAAVAAASEATEDVRGETRKRGKAAVAALRGELEAPEPPKKHRFRKFLLVMGLGGAVAFVAKRLSDRPSTTTWESASTPPPAPAAPAGGATAGAAAGAHRAETADADDQGGSSPDVAAADAAAEPHDATTPDNPAETIDVKND